MEAAAQLVIVLPSTYEFPVRLPRTIFFCRDRFESGRNMPGATFCHDMAFYLGPRQVGNGGGAGEGYFFRTDREASPHRGPLPDGNRDISRSGHERSDVAPLLEEIDRFEVIRTDQLHVAIAGCLLGKMVHLYPNSYFKNRAVYQSSLQGRYDRVVFHDRFDFPVDHGPALAP